MFEGSTRAARDVVSMNCHREDGVFVVAISGELDLSARELLLSALTIELPSDCAHVTIDAGGITFVDAAGVGALNAAAAACPVAVRLRAPSPPLRHLAGLVGLGRDDWRGDATTTEVPLK